MQYVDGIYSFPREQETKQGVGSDVLFFGHELMLVACLGNSNKKEASALSPVGHRSDSRLTEDRNEVT